MGWTFYNSSGEAMIEDGAMSIANNTNNRVVTATGADPASLNGEANLTFDGEHLTVGDGNLVIGTAGHGIDFAAQTGTASPGTVVGELLDHYESGTWTPTIQDTTGSDSESQTYSSQLGTYVRIGKVVHFSALLRITSFGTLTTGNPARLAGLPFTHENAVIVRYATVFGDNLAVAAAGYSLVAELAPNVSHFLFKTWDATTGATTTALSELSSDAAIRVTGHYEV